MRGVLMVGSATVSSVRQRQDLLTSDTLDYPQYPIEGMNDEGGCKLVGYYESEYNYRSSVFLLSIQIILLFIP